MRHSLATMERNHARSELSSPRSWRRLRHAFTEASCTASSAAIRSESITAASLYAGLRSGSMSIAKESASPSVARCMADGRCSITALIMLLPDASGPRLAAAGDEAKGERG